MARYGATRLTQLLRRRILKLLRRHGILLRRVHGAAAPSLDEYVEHLQRRTVLVDKVVCLGNAPLLEDALRGMFSRERISVCAHTGTYSHTDGAAAHRASRHPSEVLLVSIGADFLVSEDFFESQPWVLKADVLLVHAPLGFFWSGRGDLCGIVDYLQKMGFRFADRLEHGYLTLANAQSKLVVFVFERTFGKAAIPIDRSSELRTSESIACLSNPIGLSSDLQNLGDSARDELVGGLYNPGAAYSRGRVVLLARGEHSPWAERKKTMQKFMKGWQPVMIELDGAMSVVGRNNVSFRNPGGPDHIRIEDFRLFRHRQQLFSNHSMVFCPGKASRAEEPVRVERLATRTAISALDQDTATLSFLGIPKIDRPLRLVEKNWVFFECEAALYLIYSFNPYILLRAKRWESLEFETVHLCHLKIPFGGDAFSFRNSSNPIPYDNDHFLQLVHKVYDDKRYCYWAVLINRRSILPALITARPLLFGLRSSESHIIYACSVLADRTNVLVFGGLGDFSIGVWKIPRWRIDDCWVPLGLAEGMDGSGV